MLQSKASKASDIWALACTIFEIRAGCPLFESSIGSYSEVLEEMLRILGPPPEQIVNDNHTDVLKYYRPSICSKITHLCQNEWLTTVFQILFSYSCRIARSYLFPWRHLLLNNVVPVIIL